MSPAHLVFDGDQLGADAAQTVQHAGAWPVRLPELATVEAVADALGQVVRIEPKKS